MMLVVKNGTESPVPIPELKQMLPADGKFYTLPLEIAKKYAKYLIPIKLLDESAPVTSNDNVKIIYNTPMTSASSVTTSGLNIPKKKGGRPFGSKNKPKTDKPKKTTKKD